MLRTLSIRDFVIVDAIELEFSAGFSVLTGETGAGKSILIDALTLALGGRGDASVVREGAARTEISADFAIDTAVGAWLTNAEFPHEEDGVLLRRVIDNAGRSRAFINGSAATAAQLRELGELLVDIHGQHAHQSLLRTDAQRLLLDTQAGLQVQASVVAEAYRAWHAVQRAREAFESNAKNILQERERLEWQVSELDKLALQPGEWTEVSNEHSRLSHAASLIDGAQEGLTVLSESEQAGSEQALLSQLSALNLKLSRLAEVDVSLKPVLELLEPAQIQMQEAVYALNDYLSRMELDPARLREVETRLEVIHATARKYHMEPDDLPQELAALSAQLRQLADISDLDGLRTQEQKMQADYLVQARKLSKARAKSAERLASAVSAAMQELSMAGGSFAIALNPCEATSYGLEQVEFLVAGHAGVLPRPLAKVASGGELARIALAISVITATTGSNHPVGSKPATLIFDEVDSGIGGAVAEIVGRLLKKLGQERQVLCVTHLPQVASQANQHFQVSKSSHDGKTVSHIALLDQKSRVEEIARMLGGLEITATTRKHARELLAS